MNSVIPQSYTAHPPPCRAHTATGHRFGSGFEVTQHRASDPLVSPQTSMSSKR